MKARTTSKKGNPIFAAIGVKAVAMDHQTTPNPNTRFPPTVSAQIPPAIYTSIQWVRTSKHKIHKLLAMKLSELNPIQQEQNKLQ